MRTTALIFDLDGTVLDNEGQYGEAFRKVLKDLGVDTDKEYPHTAGIGVKENWPNLIKEYEIETKRSLEDLERSTRAYYEDIKGEVSLMPGFEDFIRSSREMGYLTALATSNIWMTVQDVFDEFNIQEFFDVVTTGEEVDEKKPNPSIFILTSQKLGLDPKECVVFEDAESGINAAKSAKMSCVGVARDSESEKLLNEADMIIQDFTEITLDELPKKED